MKADWDKLGKKYKNSASVMIVDVDCTADGQSTCGSQGVKGYPTIKYYMAGQKGKAYEQGRDYKSLENFVKTKLDIAKCDAKTGKNCMELEKKFIAANKGKSKTELEALLAEKTQANKDAKAEKRAAEKEHQKKLKGYRKSEKLFNMAANILKTLIKDAPTSQDEL
jgi:hypothetical protein